MNKKRYEQWVNKVCQFIQEVGPQLNLNPGAMQSNIEKLGDNNPEIIFLGHDAHELGQYEFSPAVRERFFKGNPYWNTRFEWKIWTNLYNAFKKNGNTQLMDDESKFVFTNAVFFTGDGVDKVNDKAGVSILDECMKLTSELVFDILKPKVLVCFSVDDVFSPLNKATGVKFNNVKIFKPNDIRHTLALAEYEGVEIIGMPHPSGAHGVMASLPTIAQMIQNIYEGKTK